MSPRNELTVILTHENADFDALASLLAASKLYPRAIPVLPRRINRNGRAFLALYGGALPFVAPDDLPRGRITGAILVDTQSLTTLKKMDPQIQVNIIDHHELSRELPAGWTYTGEPTGATTTLLVEQIAEQGLTLSPLEATLLLLGIYEDTGQLTYESTTPRDLRVAAWLLEQGANLAVVNEYLHHPLAPDQRALYEQLIEQTETLDLDGQTVMIAWAEAPELTEEISTLAHKLRDLFEPAALFVLVALDRRVQMVARSTTDSIDVSQIATHFGGGGHPRAAAALIRERTLDEVRSELRRLLPRFVRPAITVGQIMSYGVQTFSPQMTVQEAAERMQRLGHEGYPVVDNGRIVGLLTRQAVDRALRHGLSGIPIERVMEKGEVYVSPDDSIERLQQVMTTYGWGQVPVVAEGRLVGIVTRTDLINLWGMPSVVSRRQEIADLLSRSLPPALLDLVRHISQMADEMGYNLYFVGGLVRDLLLGIPNTDIDLVVEGEAIRLAHRLRRKYGGRVRSHRRFGTAKWLLPGSRWEGKPGIPKAIDFVTARTEFYEHPTALPQVERGSIKLDLHRRDFTINTLAICLNPDRFGELLDFYGGEKDLREGIIRVLHSLSFVDDPTRMLRAARLEQRLGFRIEARTEELIREAAPLLRRVSGDRVRHELELILQEREPERVLARLESLGVLAQLHPDLTVDDWLRAAFSRLREGLASGAWRMAPEDELPSLIFPYFGLLAYRLNREARETLLKRLKVQARTATDVRWVHHLRDQMDTLSQPLRPSRLYRLLHAYRARVLLVGWAATENETARAQIAHFYHKLRHVRPTLTGHDLLARGLRPGPSLGRLLERLRDAWLDGEVTSPEEEEALLERLLEEMGEEGEAARRRGDEATGR